ncbi:hypothetical protein [Chitinophaga japonensis]|uniref:Uncharacterized protein n=1 Tax=Chitinophaga japonensis TaxID=104662 RepID=A0A562TD49_CHIJA|nr:hypothetical protein [Chitinophaga japonensis]TWI91432.1 hypothetical protein LX66_0801 [Chitinophaga japonensis]
MNVNRYRLLCVALAAVMLASCTPGRQRPAPGTAHSDLKAYFESEALQATTKGLQLHKTVTLNGQRDTVIMPADTLALQHLLRPFIDADINKPSLRDAYRTDTVTDLFSGSSSIMYSARDAGTNPEQVILNMDKEGRIATVHMLNHVRNVVYEYRQKLFYQHLKNIHITTYQKIAFLQPRELDVQVLLAPKN